MSPRLRKRQKKDEVHIKHVSSMMVFSNRDLVKLIVDQATNVESKTKLMMLTRKIYFEFSKYLNKDIYLSRKCMQYVLFHDFVTPLLECSVILRTNDESCVSKYVSRMCLSKIYAMDLNLFSNLERLVSICHHYYLDGSCEFIRNLAMTSTTDLRYFLWLAHAIYLITCNRNFDGWFILTMFATNPEQRYLVDWMWNNRVWEYLFMKCPIDSFPLFMNSFRPSYYLELAVSHHFSEFFCATSYESCQILVQRLGDSLDMLDNPAERMQAYRVWTSYLMSFDDPKDAVRISHFSGDCIDQMFVFNALVATLSLKKVLPHFCIHPETTINLLIILDTPETSYDEIAESALKVIEDFLEYTRKYIDYLRVHPNDNVIVPGVQFPLTEKDMVNIPTKWFKLKTITDEQEIAQTNLNFLKVLFERQLCKKDGIIMKAETSFQVASKMLDRKNRQKKRLRNPVIEKLNF